MPLWAAFYLSPTGRTSRLFYWLFGFLPLSLLGFGLGFFPDTARHILPAAILLLWPQAVILAHRLHDINVTGWWVTVFWALPTALVLLHAPVPPATGTLVGWLAAIALGLIPGTRGPNRYGSDPRANRVAPTIDSSLRRP